MSKRSTGVMRFKADGTPVDDDDGVLKDGEWVLVSPMFKDASNVPVADAVAIEDARTAYIARMTRRAPAQGMQDTRDATVNDARAAYIDRLTRKGRNKAVRDSGVAPAAWLK